AGPGDPGLLTLKAKDCISQADAIIYDHLANKAFLAHASKRAELIYVGKKGGYHTIDQEEINRLMVEKAMGGLKVVRLKGGDPFIFGRGGEEAQALAKAEIPFEVIPGVTSAVAVPAYAGIPLTHRDYTSTVAFITGHEDPKKGESRIAWDKVATGVGTLVFLMGMRNLAKIAESLITHGRSIDTPVAVIERGTMTEQRTVVGSIGNITELVKKEALKPPAIIVVGDIVTLRDQLNWFEKKPLFGRRIVITRAREQASGFLVRLSELGVECIEFPTIEVLPPKSWEAMDRAIRGLERYQWILFTSVNGVKYFFERLEASGKDARALKGINIGGIGPKTAQAIYKKGIKPDLVPSEYRAEAIVDGLSQRGIKGMRVLLPRAIGAREILPVALARMGATVDEVPAYRTVIPDHHKGRVREMLEKGQIDMVTFTSSSTVINFVKMFESEGEGLQRWMEKVAVACIGPITAETAQKKDFTVAVIPPEYTIESLTNAIIQYFEKR
ncbi:MAG: uroporphyrinogen-III C-methyltransferase, partial [Pseudomonadota bacterium]